MEELAFELRGYGSDVMLLVPDLMTLTAYAAAALKNNKALMTTQRNVLGHTIQI